MNVLQALVILKLSTHCLVSALPNSRLEYLIHLIPGLGVMTHGAGGIKLRLQIELGGLKLLH